MEKTKKTRTKSNSWIFLLLLCVATCFMSIGYAAISSIDATISGTLLAEAQEGIFITDAVYSSDINANLTNSRINQYYQTMLSSSIELSETDSSSSLTYTITIYNSTTDDYYFKETTYMEEFYDNSNIEFKLDGLDVGQILSGQDSVSFNITFSYVGSVIPEVNTLNSRINFNFEKAYKIMYANIDNSTGKYPTVIFDGDTLNLDLNEDCSTLYTTVKMNNENVDDYTYDMGVLTLQNITGDIEITAQERFDKETNIKIGEQKVVVPEGGAISQIDKEYTSVADGIVTYILPKGTQNLEWTADSDGNGIYDVQENYDQFVWVPVENAILDLSGDSDALSSDTNIKAAVQTQIDQGKYPMAIKNSAGNYIGVLYQFSYSNSAITISPLSDWSPNIEVSSSYREPDTLYDVDTSSNLTQVSGILNNTNISDEDSFYSELQKQFKTMVETVDSKGGFWVGRYETTGLTNNTDETQNRVKVASKRGQTEGIDSTTWYRMYAEQALYSSKAGLTATSSMIWASQYDQIMIWMKDVDNTSQGSKFIVNAIGMANLGAITGVSDGWATTSSAPTGYLDAYKVNNVFDIAGNVYEWEIGAYSSNMRSKRGGYYDVNDWLLDYAGADARHRTSPTYAGTVNGTRMVIY